MQEGRENAVLDIQQQSRLPETELNEIKRDETGTALD